MHLESTIRSAFPQIGSMRLHRSQLLVFVHLLLCGISSGGTTPAVIVFGDSTVDTGNNNFIPTIARSNFAPYGQDYPGGVATGRFSNGRLSTDFISEAFGLPPTIPAYLDPNRTIEELASGVCFASAATGLDNATSNMLSVISVSEQLEYFKEYRERLGGAMGEAKAQEIISEALYVLSIGTNDFIENYYNLPRRREEYTLPEYEAYLLCLIEMVMRELHGAGARKMDLTSLPPMGCLPAERVANRDAPGECIEEYNRVARSFNAKAQVLLRKLNEELPGLQAVYGDVYNVLSEVVDNPSDYGFENAVQGCCGTGLFEMGFFCSFDSMLICQNASKYVFFDAIHPTERMYKIVADRLMNTTLHVFL